jgi:hypothetical protein
VRYSNYNVNRNGNNVRVIRTGPAIGAYGVFIRAIFYITVWTWPFDVCLINIHGFIRVVLGSIFEVMWLCAMVPVARAIQAHRGK